MESMKICETVLSRLRTCCITEKESGFWVLDWLGCFFGESALAASITGFASRIC